MLDNNHLRKLSRDLISEPDDFMHSFRKNLFMYIERKDITLAEVAEAADIPFSTLRAFLYGDSKDCHLSTAVKLARVLCVSVDELVGSGTISPQTCESLQLVRQLPESFTHFVRWSIHFHYDMLTSEKVSQKAIEVMMAECADNGNLKMTNDLEIMDVSDLNDDIRPKVFMGIRIPCDHYAPHYFAGDILLIANDRSARNDERVVIVVGDNMWILRRKEELVNGEKKVNYYSIRDGRLRTSEDRASLVIGYVAKTVHGRSFDK